jgi:hypothetical protein
VIVSKSVTSLAERRERQRLLLLLLPPPALRSRASEKQKAAVGEGGRGDERLSCCLGNRSRSPLERAEGRWKKMFVTLRCDITCSQQH